MKPAVDSPKKQSNFGAHYEPHDKYKISAKSLHINAVISDKQPIKASFRMVKTLRES